MSLINEALKRARVEAARQDAAAKGVPASALPVYVPPRRRPWLAPVAGFLAGLTVVAMAAGAFWLVRRPVATAESPTPATSAETSVASLEQRASEAPPVAQNQSTPPAPHEATHQMTRSVGTRLPPSQSASIDTEPTPPGTSRRPGATGAVEPPSASPEPLPSTPALPTERPISRQAVQTPPPPSAVAPPAAASPRAAPPAMVPPPAAPAVLEQPPAAMPSPDVAPTPVAPPSSSGDSGRTYLREAAPAGPSVKLEFIVWSENQPFAQINGQLLSVGQSVEDYTLLTVERERVELEGGGVRFWLRVR